MTAQRQNVIPIDQITKQITKSVAKSRIKREAGTGVLRKARTSDVLAMQAIINDFADRGSMLPRSLSELYENVRDFYVVEEPGEAGKEIVGCAALHVTWKDLAELKSLAVLQGCQGRGYGRLLVQACLDEAASVGVRKIFALTYVPELFHRLGFAEMDRALLPRKVWTECVFCPKFPSCGEIAVLFELPDGD